MKPKLEVCGVSYSYHSLEGETLALSNISFTVDNGEFIAIVGPSGCGKSTLLSMLSGLIEPDEGEIIIDGVPRTNSGAGIGYMLQRDHLFEWRTILSNAELGLEIQKKLNDSSKKKLHEMLNTYGLEAFKNARPSELSGGMRQRAALVRTLALEPDLLLLDEPFSALDYYLKEKLQLEQLEELRNYDGDVLLVTHSRDEIYRFCSTIHVINEGEIVVSGAVKDVFKEPETVSAAKLTGCKNILDIKYVDAHTFYVPNWDIQVIIRDREVPKDTPFIGIRAHYFTAAHESEKENVMECRLKQILDDPFEVTLILENDLWWKIPKERWKDDMKEQVPERLVVPEESIFFLKDR